MLLRTHSLAKKYHTSSVVRGGALVHAGFRPSAECDYCDADFDTKHLACDCPALHQLRQNLLGPLKGKQDSQS